MSDDLDAIVAEVLDGLGKLEAKLPAPTVTRGTFARSRSHIQADLSTFNDQITSAVAQASADLYAKIEAHLIQVVGAELGKPLTTDRRKKIAADVADEIRKRFVLATKPLTATIDPGDPGRIKLSMPIAVLKAEGFAAPDERPEGEKGGPVTT